MNSPPKYSRTAIALHWVMAVLIIGTVVLIWFADYVADEHVRWVIDTHKSIGITVLGLAIWRLDYPYAAGFARQLCALGEAGFRYCTRSFVCSAVSFAFVRLAA